MPFITTEARSMTDTLGPQEVGDHCFIHYREMLRAWRASPRWTTAHEIYKNMVMIPKASAVLSRPDQRENQNNERAALELAWQVFFQLHVMPYELQKRTLNGEVDY